MDIDACANTFIAKCIVDMHALHGLFFCITNGSWDQYKDSVQLFNFQKACLEVFL